MEYLATGSSDKTFKIRNVDKGFKLINTIQEQTYWVKSAAFSANGASCNGFFQQHLQNKKSQLLFLQIKYLATGQEDNTCKIWNDNMFGEII
ncbi:hypothetical protein ABPG74_019895, partial [Tetrahymena malaccensis]